MQKTDNVYSSSPGYTKPRVSGLCKLAGNLGSFWEQDDPTTIHKYFQKKKCKTKVDICKNIIPEESFHK